MTPLTRERTGPVCHPDYWYRLQGKQAVLLHTGTRPDAWADWTTRANQPIASSAERYFDHFYFSLQGAVAGLGIAIGPEPLVADDIESGHLVGPLGFLGTETDYVVLSLKNPERDDLLGAFLSWLGEELAPVLMSVLEEQGS